MNSISSEKQRLLFDASTLFLINLTPLIMKYVYVSKTSTVLFK